LVYELQNCKTLHIPRKTTSLRNDAYLYLLEWRTYTFKDILYVGYIPKESRSEHRVDDLALCNGVVI